MTRPLLTITIPAYNVELYIEETVNSLINSKNTKEIEILIINDGSSDRTAEVAQALAAKHRCIKVINKENGGHGSAINSGLEHATGKYFRLLDGDDWFDTKEFDRYIEKLRQETSDLILTDYVECFTKANFNRLVTYYSNLPEYRQFSLDTTEFLEWGATLPTTTIKTELLKKFNLKIDEHCFYVDQEYNLACYLCAKTASYYPLAIYQYRLEREGQSMERSSLIKNVLSHEKVCSRLLTEYHKREKNMPIIRQTYLSKRVIIPMCHMQYTIACEYCKSPKYFRSFDHILKKYPNFYNNSGIAGDIIHFHRKTHGLFTKLTNPLNKFAIYKNSHISSQSKKLKFTKLLLITLFLSAVLIILDQHTGFFSSKISDETLNFCETTISSFKDGLVPGLVSFNTTLSLNHSFLFFAPLIPFLLIFGTSKTLILTISFIIYILIPSFLFSSIIKIILHRIHLTKLAKLSFLYFLLILLALSIFIYFVPINPLAFIVSAFMLRYLICTKLECIHHYIVLASLLSILVFINPAFWPLVISFYLCLFVLLTLLSYRKFHQIRPTIIKSIKNLIKILISVLFIFVLFQIA